MVMAPARAPRIATGSKTSSQGFVAAYVALSQPTFQSEKHVKGRWSSGSPESFFGSKGTVPKSKGGGQSEPHATASKHVWRAQKDTSGSKWPSAVVQPSVPPTLSAPRVRTACARPEAGRASGQVACQSCNSTAYSLAKSCQSGSGLVAYMEKRGCQAFNNMSCMRLTTTTISPVSLSTKWLVCFCCGPLRCLQAWTMERIFLAQAVFAQALRCAAASALSLRATSSRSRSSCHQVTPSGSEHARPRRWERKPL
mmetsp:Transcript_21147/g.50296  ORF Transcript_21147/g.50296 Transcript_21147/m.50296 type:complete len:254 (-) Transcript_21147:335-1096(-)